MLHCIHYVHMNVNTDNMMKHNAEQIKPEYHNRAICYQQMSLSQGGTKTTVHWFQLFWTGITHTEMFSTLRYQGLNR